MDLPQKVLLSNNIPHVQDLEQVHQVMVTFLEQDALSGLVGSIPAIAVIHSLLLAFSPTPVSPTRVVPVETKGLVTADYCWSRLERGSLKGGSSAFWSQLWKKRTVAVFGTHSHGPNGSHSELKGDLSIIIHPASF